MFACRKRQGLGLVPSIPSAGARAAGGVRLQLIDASKTQRRGWDSNPRYLVGTHALQACRFVHSRTSPSRNTSSPRPPASTPHPAFRVPADGFARDTQFHRVGTQPQHCQGSLTTMTEEEMSRVPIDVSRHMQEMERVLRSQHSPARCQELIGLLRCWQHDEVLDGASRERARVLVREFGSPAGFSRERHPATHRQTYVQVPVPRRGGGKRMLRL
jgi:hypothetical protein